MLYVFKEKGFWNANIYQKLFPETRVPETTIPFRTGYTSTKHKLASQLFRIRNTQVSFSPSQATIQITEQIWKIEAFFFIPLTFFRSPQIRQYKDFSGYFFMNSTYKPFNEKTIFLNKCFWKKMKKNKVVWFLKSQTVTGYHCNEPTLLNKLKLIKWTCFLGKIRKKLVLLSRWRRARIESLRIPKRFRFVRTRSIYEPLRLRL